LSGPYGPIFVAFPYIINDRTARGA